MASQQPGGFVMGLIVGLLLGLALALGVALYVNKVPAPFVNKVPHRTAEQDAAEAEKNKNWDPNAPLAGKVPMRPASAPATLPPATTLPGTDPAAPKGATARDPASILGERPASAPQVASTKGAPDPFTYFVQAGAFGRAEDAEQQRARLALLGVAAKVTEREQAGRTVYRVRLGPYDKKEDADAARGKLESGGVEAALVRVQK
jgi:cell division protein FtsN